MDAIRLSFSTRIQRNNDMNDKDSVILNIKDSTSKAEKYFCSYCNTRLTPLTQEDMMGAHVCTKCMIEYWPTRQSHGNVIGDNDIPIAVIDDPNKDVSSTSYKRQKLSPLFKTLEAQGFKIKSDEER
jgi:hypothetical protein